MKTIIEQQSPKGYQVQDVEGYAVPVLNEREIRASAEILFLAMLLSYAQSALASRTEGGKR
jgi:hypothetical protein